MRGHLFYLPLPSHSLTHSFSGSSGSFGNCSILRCIPKFKDFYNLFNTSAYKIVISDVLSESGEVVEEEEEFDVVVGATGRSG